MLRGHFVPKWCQCIDLFDKTLFKENIKKVKLRQ
jgi:hypothetical protein